MLETLVIPDEENPLLRRLPDEKYTFINDESTETAARRYFDEEVNSGRMERNDYWINMMKVSLIGRYNLGIKNNYLRDALILTRSQKVAIDLIKLLGKNDQNRIREDGDRYSDALCTLIDSIVGIGKEGVAIPESLLLEELNKKEENKNYWPFIFLMGHFGGEASLKELTELILNKDFLKTLDSDGGFWNEYDYNDRVSTRPYSSEILKGYLIPVFRIMRRERFKLDMTRQFHKRIWKTDSETLVFSYFHALPEISKELKEEFGFDLNKYLENNELVLAWKK